MDDDDGAHLVARRGDLAEVEPPVGFGIEVVRLSADALDAGEVLEQGYDGSGVSTLSPGSHSSLKRNEYASLVEAVSTIRSRSSVTPCRRYSPATAARAGRSPRGSGR